MDATLDRGLDLDGKQDRTLDTTDFSGVHAGLHEWELFREGVAAGRQSAEETDLPPPRKAALSTEAAGADIHSRGHWRPALS